MPGLRARPSAQEEPEPTEVRAELLAALEEAVDGDGPSARRAAAKTLARRADVSLDEWLVAARAFGRFEPPEPGERAHRVPLRVLGETEETEVFVYAPASLDATRPAPLMLAFHGTGGSGRGLCGLWRGVADELGMLVVAPSEAGDNSGYHFSERERAAALAVLRWTRRRFDVDENRVYASGISRGGHLAWDLALRHPDVLAAIAPMIGGPRASLAREQNNLRYLENTRFLSIRDLQGAQDDPGLLFNLRYAFEKLASWGAPDAELVLFEDRGHSFDFGAVDWAEFLRGARRDPAPERVIRRTCDPAESRAFWVEATRLAKDVSERVRPKITQAKWDAMDDGARRLFLLQEADERTARLEVHRDAPGRFTALTDGVPSFRLRLAREHLDADGVLTVELDGRTLRRRARERASVLLEDFVERFDRTFLPVAEVEVR